MSLSPVVGGEARVQRPDVGNSIVSSLTASNGYDSNVVMSVDEAHTAPNLCCDCYQRGMGLDRSRCPQFASAGLGI